MALAGLIRTMVLAAGAVGGVSGAMYGLLFEQSKRARRAIGKPHGKPLRADGVYLPDGTGPVPAEDPRAVDALRLAVFGDSSAAGLGAERTDDLPGVLISRNLAEESARCIRLETHAVSGSTSRHLGPQVELALLDPPDLAMIMIGANDVTARIPPTLAAALLGQAVARLRTANTIVVVGTCPDLGVVRAIPQPLRALARSWSLAVARHQQAAVLHAGGHPVPLADLLAAEFLSRDDYFSIDQFHPSAAGYEAAAAVLLPTICAALGIWEGGPLPQLPYRSQAAEALRPTARLTAAANRQLDRFLRRTELVS